MKKLSYLDQGFLSLETESHPLHVGTIQLFSLTSGDQEGKVIADTLWDYVKSRSPFNLKLKNRFFIPLRQDWVIANNLSRKHHFKFHNGINSFQDVVSKVETLHEERLNRKQPLWEIHFFPIKKEKQLAAYFKIHHACMDGIAGMRLLNGFLSSSKGSSPAYTSETQEEKKYNTFDLVLDDIKELVLNKTGPIIEIIQNYSMAAAEQKDPERLRPLPFTAPDSLLNEKFNSKRRFEFLTVDLNPLKPIRKKLDATVNDLILILCASALRSYLLQKQALPAEPLVAAVPASVRSDKTADGNQIGFLRVNLATNNASSKARVTKILESIKAAKGQLSSLSANALTTDAELVFMLGTLANATGTLRYLPPIHSLVISNVPIARRKLFLGDARLESSYPISALPPSQGLNISVFSYENQLDFGLLAAAEVLPDLQLLKSSLEKAYQELISG